MNREWIIDGLGVVRSIALAIATLGLLFALVSLAMQLWAGASPFHLSSAVAVSLLVPGILVALVASLSRVFVRRMKFESARKGA